MTEFFLKLVDMSITASWLVLVVILLRLLLKKAPKALHCALWALVAVRLVCPFSMESSFSLLPERQEVTLDSIRAETVGTEFGYIPAATIYAEDIPVSIQPEAELPQVQAESRLTGTILPNLTAVWFSGMGVMLLYALESYWQIRRRVAPSVSIGNRVYLCDHIPSPFILGVIHPRIYMPSALESRDADYVLAHERAHLMRRDHWWKPLGYILLCVYWFNPVMWIAYILLCRDIELACDEKVIRTMDIPSKKAYSTALLNCSLPQFRITACPLAFGEVGVRTRIKNILHYKKPAFWVLAAAVILCIAVSVGLLTDPAGIHLYEINDSRNYSDLLSNTEDVSLIVDGENYPVYDEASILKVLETITVRKSVFLRSRSENRDKTHQVHLRGNTCLNFSRNFQQVWIYNGVKPTCSYWVNQPGQVKEIFNTIYGENLKITAGEVTPTSLTLTYYPEDSFNTVDAETDGEYWLECWDGRQWNRQMSLRGTPYAQINTHIYADQGLHYLDWQADYGALPKGQYRVGIEFHFPDKGARKLYAEFTIESEGAVTTWFGNDDVPLSKNSRKRLPFDYPGLKGVTLQYTEEADGYKITAKTEAGSEVLITGWPILNAYFQDLSGDGIPELCTSVCEGFGMIDNRIRVYDYVAGHLYELQNRGITNYELTMREDMLVVLESDCTSGNTKSVGLLALAYDTGAVPYLKMLELNDALQLNVRTVECVDILNRKLACVSKSSDVRKLLSLLHDLRGQIQPASEEALKQAQEDSFNNCHLTINYDLGETTVSFSKNIDLVWISGEAEGYSVSDPSPIREFVERYTDGVKNKQTSGSPFATMDTPWDWTASVTANAISSAKLYACTAIAGYGNTVSTQSVNGTLSSDTLTEITAILNEIPREDFSTSKFANQSFEAEFTKLSTQVGVSLAFLDTVNDLAVIFRYSENGTVEMIVTDETEQYGDRYIGNQHPEALWVIQNDMLGYYMSTLLEDVPVITYTVGAEYNWQKPQTFAEGAFTLDLYLIEGWESETVKTRNHSGIRIRPEEIDDSWIYFSYWPDGYDPKEEDNRRIDRWEQGDYQVSVSWPPFRETEDGLTSEGQVWSYRKTETPKGDFVIINDNADSWFLEYDDQIGDIIAISQFSMSE